MPRGCGIQQHLGTDFDAAIIGGGPGGSAAAAYLAKAGLDCVLLEREKFPREHVGESLVPSSTRVFRELGFVDEMERARFPRKYGAVWTAPTNPKAYSLDFDGLQPDYYADVRFAEVDQPGVPLNYTWHVDRGKFDQLLMQHAARLGADVREGVAVSDVEMANGDGHRLRYKSNGSSGELRAKVVVDASGRRTFLGNRLKLRVRDRYFDQYALHTWFGGFDRATICEGPSKADYIYIHFLPVSNTWMWQIPITDDITSIGVVTQKSQFASARETRERFFWDCVETRPELASALRGSEQLRPLKEEGDYSYAMKQICGDGFVLVGDAARFVDPIFSTGVSIALNSARFATRDIISAAEQGDFNRSRFSTFETTMKTGVRNWYRFIALYYRLNVLFTAFVQNPRYREDIIKLLQGDVYDEDEPEVLRRMREKVELVENNPDHIWHQFLGTLRADELAAAL